MGWSHMIHDRVRIISDITALCLFKDTAVEGEAGGNIRWYPSQILFKKCTALGGSVYL